MIRQVKINPSRVMVPDDSVMTEVRELIGADGYNRLLSDLGGKKLFVPKSCGAHHPVSISIGPELAAILAERFGGESLTLPLSLRKQHCILEDLKAGMGTAEVARKYWCSDRYVRYLKANSRSDRECVQLGLL